MNLYLNSPKWHVVYTRPKCERKVASSVSEMGIESYLPLHKVTRQWSDRVKQVEVSLFPSYLFVKVTDVSRASLFSIKDIVKFISIERKPVIVRDKEIETIKKVLDKDVEVQNDEYFQKGMKVKIIQGQFEGLEGVVVQRNSDTRLLIRIDCLMKAFSFNIPANIVDPVLV